MPIPFLRHKSTADHRSPAADLRIAGLTPFTTIDFPGKMAAVVWCRGCALKCRYCQNDDLRSPKPQRGDMGWKDALRFFEKRRGMLEGVVFSGGEPTLQKSLPLAMQQVREMGYAVALHTAGTAPARLPEALAHVDWVGFDVKTLFEDYGRITGAKGSGDRVLESLKILLESGVPFEVRTTVDPEIMTPAGIRKLARTLSAMGVKNYRLQEVTQSPHDLSGDFEIEFGALFDDFSIRRTPLKATASG